MCNFTELLYCILLPKKKKEKKRRQYDKFVLLAKKFILSGVISGALLYIRDDFPAVRDNYFLQVQSNLVQITGH